MYNPVDIHWDVLYDIMLSYYLHILTEWCAKVVMAYAMIKKGTRTCHAKQWPSPKSGMMKPDDLIRSYHVLGLALSGIVLSVKAYAGKSGSCVLLM